MKNQTPPSSDPNILAVVHRAGRIWRGLIAALKSGKPVLIASREFPLDRISRLDEWLNENQAGSVLCVLPAASVICRVCALPDAPPEQLEQALRLQAESHLLGVSSAHRLAMAVLPNAPGETSRTGIILAWPQTSPFEAPPTTRPVTFVPDVAALAAVLNGQRPAGALLWLDRADGSVALALTHAAGAVLRATREDAESTDNWQRSIGRIIAETGMNVAHSGAFIDSLVRDAQQKAASLKLNDAALFVPQELISTAANRVQGLSDDPIWWSQYGVAAGALLARTGPLADLTQMQQAPPREVPTRIKTALEALSRPRAATAVVIACAVLLMFGPVALSGARLAVLKLRFGDVQKQLDAAVASRNQLAMYRELEHQQIWPMTKLLADITTNAPMGIKLESIRIDGGKDFSVSGTAIRSDGHDPMDVVGMMQENLGKAGLFNEIRASTGNSSNLGMFKFDLSGKVTKPYYAPKYDIALDFGKWTFADRREGRKPGAADSAKPGGTAALTTTTAPAISTSQPQQLVDASRTTALPGGDDAVDDPIGDAIDESDDQVEPDGSAGRAPRTPTVAPGGDNGPSMPGAPSGDGPAPDSRYIPPPLSTEQIQAMSEAELKQALASVGKARENPGLDAETKTRLIDEWVLLLEQLRKIKHT